MSNLRIDLLLVERGLARSRGHAADLVKAKRVLVGNRELTKPSQSVAMDSEVRVIPADEYVSRAGLKLKGALDAFGGLEVVGKTCLDVGASTGGFTDVLLRHGAAKVVAIDVGHEQFSAELSNNPRVQSFEGINAREISLEGLRELTQELRLEIDLVVADLSFISLTLVLPALAQVAPKGDFVLLIKPQFEVGKQSLSASGVVSDHRLRAFAIKQVVDCCHELGLGVVGLERSELPGTHGNIEYLIWISTAVAPNRSRWTEGIEQLARESK
ncbi:MAG: TlyA family rRNA (cytidine-2'-O)-methyltransferase [Actinobacteria bacterium]|nr:TlyA family rRNA (cytidine-2'-O)-methyltransferase [Actinomycetota bacterium]